MSRNDPNACAEARELLEDLVAGRLADPETARMLAHLRRCEPCSELFELHAQLCEWEAPDDGSLAEDFAALRGNVLSQLESEGLAGPPALRALFASPIGVGGQPWRPGWRRRCSVSAGGRGAAV